MTTRRLPVGVRLLNNVKKVMETARLRELPKREDGVSEIGLIKFCTVDFKTEGRLEDCLTQQAVLRW